MRWLYGRRIRSKRDRRLTQPTVVSTERPRPPFARKHARGIGTRTFGGWVAAVRRNLSRLASDDPRRTRRPASHPHQKAALPVWAASRMSPLLEPDTQNKKQVRAQCPSVMSPACPRSPGDGKSDRAPAASTTVWQAPNRQPVQWIAAPARSLLCCSADDKPTLQSLSSVRLHPYIEVVPGREASR